MRSLSLPSVPAEAASSRHWPTRRSAGTSTSTKSRYWLKAIALNSAALTLIGLALYGPASWLEYGRDDDYWFVLHNATNSPEKNAQNLFEAGRFVGALISRCVFPYVDTVPELLQMRLVAILALSLSGTALSIMALRLLGAPRSRVLRVLALLVGLLALVTPAAPSAATWGVMALELWALPLGLAGGLVATCQTRVVGLRWELTAGFLVLLAALTYQPLAGACLLPVFMWSALRWAHNQPPQWRRPIVTTALLATSLTFDIVLVKFFHLAGDDRLGGHGLSESLVWFVAFLARAAAAAVPTTILSVCVSFLVLLLGLLSPVFLNRRFLALSAAVIAACLVASGTLVLGDQLPSYRQVMATQTMLWAGSLTCLVVTIQTHEKSPWLNTERLLAVLTIGATAFMAISGFRAYVYLANPNAVDWASLQCGMRQTQLTDDSVLVLSPPEASVSRVLDAEYGGIASSTPWALANIVWLADVSVNQGQLTRIVNVEKLRVVEPSATAATGPTVFKPNQHCALEP